MTRRYASPPPVYRVEKLGMVGWLFQAIAPLVIAGVFLWAVDTLFWDHRIREEAATVLREVATAMQGLI